MEDIYIPLIKKENKVEARRMAMCETASKICLYYGKPYTEEHIAKFWNHNSYSPSPEYLDNKILNKNMKWFLHEKINISEKVWNGSFLHGITISGKIETSVVNFPLFYWYGNKEIEEMLKECPYYAKSRSHTSKKYHNVRYWWLSASLCLKYDKRSISYLAGVLSTGRKYEENGEIYAVYNKNLESLFNSWKIPIEKKNYYFIFISPIWIALLTPWMPESRKKWLNVKSYKSEEYAFILWRVFIGKTIVTKGLPFLPSLRTFYYRYHTMDNLEKKWVDYKLVELDPRFKEAVQKWGNNV